VVEDEDELRRAASKILARRGFTVLQAADGTAAADLLQSPSRIDVILLDATIPGVASREVAVKARLFQPEANVVLTSAYSREAVMGSFEGVQVAGFVRKPYRLVELVEVLRSLRPA
jgi:CheY-like chemotaxis protein